MTHQVHQPFNISKPLRQKRIKDGMQGGVVVESLAADIFTWTRTACWPKVGYS